MTDRPPDPWFSSLPAARREALLARARASAAGAGARVYGLGDPAHRFQQSRVGVCIPLFRSSFRNVHVGDFGHAG